MLSRDFVYPVHLKGGLRLDLYKPRTYRLHGEGDPIPDHEVIRAFNRPENRMRVQQLNPQTRPPFLGILQGGLTETLYNEGDYHVSSRSDLSSVRSK